MLARDDQRELLGRVHDLALDADRREHQPVLARHARPVRARHGHGRERVTGVFGRVFGSVFGRVFGRVFGGGFGGHGGRASKTPRAPLRATLSARRRPRLLGRCARTPRGTLPDRPRPQGLAGSAKRRIPRRCRSAQRRGFSCRPTSSPGQVFLPVNGSAPAEGAECTSGACPHPRTLS
ncbi:MAG: hypothetical protein FJ298_04735 [Planctomycetes bacterium]|nr:hypothetical protein [Planctomycetota bacterium]